MNIKQYTERIHRINGFPLHSLSPFRRGQNNRGRLVLAAALILFCIFAAVFLFTPGRRATRNILVESGKHTAIDDMLSSLNVTSIAQDSKKLIWIGTSAGINIYDGQRFIQFFHDSKDTTALPDDYINMLFLDRKGRMWIGTQNGLARYIGGYRFKRYHLQSSNTNILWIKDGQMDGEVRVGNGKEVFRITESDIVKENGADKYKEAEKKKAIAKTLSAFPDNLLIKPRELASATFIDNAGNLWIGYRNAGYQVMSANIADFKKANDNPLAKETEGRDITCIKTVGHYLLAGTTLRLYTYDTQTHAISQAFYKQLFNEPQELRGIVKLNGRIFWLIGNRKILECTVGNSMSATPKTVYSISEDKTLGSGTCIGNNLFVSCNNRHLIRCNTTTGQTDSIKISCKWYDNETQLTSTNDGKVLLFMKDMHIALLDPTTLKLTEIKTHDEPDYGNIDAAFALQDSRGTVWLGTKRYGLYRMDLHTGGITRMDFLNDVHIQGLAEDNNRNIWITTLKDAVCYLPQTGEASMNSLVSSSKNHTKTQFFDNSITIAPNGNVVIGSSDGCEFLPADIELKTKNARKQKQGLLVYAINIQTSGGQQLTACENTRNGQAFTLANDENSIEFMYFRPNYSQTSSLMYQYKLEGFDTEWHEATYQHSASYNNLPEGKYKFRLRLTASPQLPPVEETTVNVKIMPSPWNCAAAWLLYAIFCGLVLYYINSLYLRIRANQLLLEQEKNEREREKQAKEMNMSFFANISHEFRNPITIIAGPLIQLSANESLPQNVKTTLQRICMSVNRMLRLIDQMLDFNQLETDALRLKVSKTNIEENLERLTAAFVESANVRGINFEVKCGNNIGEKWIDTDKFEKIISNLFTNALKHTPDNGNISIMARTEQEDTREFLVVNVTNSGSHIEEERMPDVFKRYYQLADSKGSHRYGWGTGIGLYYVKRLVGLHHGNIGVKNIAKECGGGVSFIFRLPCCKDAFSDNELCETKSEVLQIPITYASTDGTTTSGNADDNLDRGGTTEKKRKKILIVDDDIDVAQYIRSIFCSRYTVENRYSAETALSDIAEIAPDIILSDIIMGKMSGYDFCKELKSNLMTCHIPVVMITAKSNIDEQIKGLRLGAVGYVTKPFDPEYLQAVVETQLENVNTIRRRLGESTETEELSDALSEEDRRFMDELYRLMGKRAAEMELNVQTICHDLLISQSKFNYKLKELTGDTPGVFFRKYKLNKAAKYLKDGKMTISEIAIATGFATAAHFSVAFKKQFGVSPSEY